MQFTVGAARSVVKRSRQVRLLSLCWLGLSLAGLFPCLPAQQDPSGIEFFEKKIRPLLAENCYACHSSKTLATADLLLDSKTGVLKGGSRGTAVIPGAPDDSLIVRALSYDDPDLKMPPSGKLSNQQIADVRRWIELGAADPRTDEAQPATTDGGIDFDEAGTFWAFQPVTNRAPPEVRQSDWPRTYIDHFILAKLEANGLRPAPPADKRTLLRRLKFDLTGLPPTPEEIENFLRDESPEAYEKVIERLLASPHYGERWARHWLDLVRFGETSGHEFDPDKADAWRYRDYAIRSFNQDLPYDRFVREHIAGDLLPQQRLTPDGTHWDSPLATGFFGLGEERNAADDVAQVRADRIDNQLDVLGKTFLGLTIGCARCHDHKFDPIPTEDYYSLAGILDSSQVIHAPLDAPSRVRRMKRIEEELIEVNGQITSLMRQARLERIHEIKPYLLAAADVLAKQQEKTKEPIENQLGGYGLSPQILKQWFEVLERAAEEPDNVFLSAREAGEAPGRRKAGFVRRASLGPARRTPRVDRQSRPQPSLSARARRCRVRGFRRTRLRRLDRRGRRLWRRPFDLHRPQPRCGRLPGDTGSQLLRRRLESLDRHSHLAKLPDGEALHTRPLRRKRAADQPAQVRRPVCVADRGGPFPAR